MKLFIMIGLSAMTLGVAACGSAENSGRTENQSTSQPESQGDETHSATGKVDSLAGTEVTISHEAIQSLGWPAMTMTFTAKDAALLNGIKPGDRVSFAFTKSGSTSTLTSISKQ